MLAIFSKKTSPKGYKDFTDKYPEYKETLAIDKIREESFKRLDKNKHVYLDYTGGNLYAESQVEKHLQLLKNNLFGNPHSFNPTSMYATEQVEGARNYVLKYFNAGDDYYCVFTPNASGALKIVGESYPFDSNSHFLLTFDNHNSVNGIRQFAAGHNAQYTYSPLLNDDLRLDEKKLEENLAAYPNCKNKLFAFPAQSNVSGVKHPLSWIKKAQDKGWDVLLDAAAFVPSNKLDLSKYKPQFVSISFYKIFGYPTGLGCLLIRKDVFPKLRRPWFAGGTIKIVSVQGDSYYFENGHPRFEDGTVNYLDIPAIKIGLEHIENIGIDTINKRISALTGLALDELQKLKHSNGKPLVVIYGPKDNKERGGTISLNFLDDEGKLFGFMDVEQEAAKKGISIRTGCFCNPGIDETNHALTEDELKRYFKDRPDGSYFELIEFLDKLRGAVRISLGYVTNYNDIAAFLEFAKSFLNRKVSNK